MAKTINLNRKIIYLIIIIIVIIVYYFFYRKSNNYQEIEENSTLEELTTYEEAENIQTEKQQETTEENTEDEEKIVVHITGEVNNEGVIELESGARVIDAVNMAGGFTETANIDKVNLAYVLTDAIKIYIPSQSEEEENVTITREYILTDTGEDIVTEEKEMEIQEKSNLIVNINSATQTELETLPGIGPSIALKIISYRKENGQFSSIEDIKNVSGIGDAKFNGIKELISV